MRRLGVLRNRKQVAKVVKELDAFPKIPDGYKETTASGGGISLLVFVAIAILVVSEIRYHASTELKFKYEIDKDFEQNLKINIDITVAMKCEWIGADVLDLTNQPAHTFGALKEEPVHFELSPQQRSHFKMTQNLNEYIRNEYHAIHKFLWNAGFTGMANYMPEREVKLDTPEDACRLHGTLTVNKVAGNFHITAGKSVPVFPRGHAHLAITVKDQDYNFSHRIDHFSFGEATAGIINPLDSEEKTSDNNYHMFQYFIQVVPTKVRTTFSALDTYQFAVTEKNRSIDHSKGSHGVPGIFVKYDLSPIKVDVSEEHKPYWQFLVRLCGIIGGIFATSGMLHKFVGFTVDLICCRYKWGRYDQQKHASLGSPATSASRLNTDTTQSASLLPPTSLLAQEAPTPPLHPVPS